MRVLFVCPNLQGNGAERHWSILLPELARRGASVGFATLDGRGPFYDQLEADGIPGVCFAEDGESRYGSAALALRRATPDVIVTRGTSAHGLGMFAAAGRDTKWVVNWHRPPGLQMNQRRAAILRFTLRKANEVLAVSDSQVEELLMLGVGRASIRVIHNGTDFQPRDADRADLRAALGLDAGSVAVLIAGRLDPQKRVDRFIDALALAQRVESSLIGLIAGAGALEAELKSHAESAGVNLRFLGRREDMPSVLAAADILCLTSDLEALPYVVLEGMASGLPVIATRIGALPEIVTPEIGVTTDVGDTQGLADAMVALARDANLRRSMGEAGRNRQRRLFSSASMADAYFQAIHQVMGWSAARPADSGYEG